MTALIATPGCGGGDDPPPKENTTSDSASSNGDAPSTAPSDPSNLPLPEVKTGLCRVYTPQPGFYVLVDGEIVRDENSGKWLTTPCAVTLPVGSHDVKVARPGFRDTPYPARVAVGESSPAEVVLEPVEDPLGLVDSVLDATYRQAKVGEPVALESLNSTGLETDPFVTADGLAIYFAANRPEGNGIYYATRTDPYGEFYPPELLKLSRGFEQTATPSITADSRSVVYALPDKQRVVALLRPSPLGDFVDKQNLKFSTRTAERWRSAQMLADGLRFYWTVETNGQLETRVTGRRSLEDRFGQVLRTDMPGTHPCLSRDGLRQYVYDGKTLRRARRERTTSKFSRLEVIRELPLEKYVHDPTRRQYFVSDDEQWLFYCDNPQDNGDLYMVRLSEGKSWGFAVHGTSIPQRTFVAETTPANRPDPNPKPDPVTGPDVDPRTIPLPYTAHHRQFTSLLAAKKYAEAKQLVERSLADPKFARDRELLQWDGQDVGRVMGFWDDVRKSLRSMKPGDEIRFGPVKVTLVRFEKDEITAQASAKQVQKKIQEMGPVDLLAIADRVIDKSDEAGQARMGAFLYYDPAGGDKSAQVRFERAGGMGEEFYERLAARVLRQARQEFDRNNIASGLGFIAKVTADFPETKTAGEAKQLEQEAYQFTKWERRGRWQNGQPGEYVAPQGRAADSYLRSPEQYENFELRLEWKTAAGGAGGAFFRFRGSGDPNLFGYKIGFADDYSSGRLDPQTTGALFNQLPPTVNAVRKRGEWNELKMQVRGTHVVVEINGRKVLDRRPEVTDFIPLRGYVMLDGVAGGITYRKTLLIELPPVN